MGPKMQDFCPRITVENMLFWMNFTFLVLIFGASRYGWVTTAEGNEKWGSAVGKKMTSKWSESIKGRADILQQKNWLWSFKSIAKCCLFYGCSKFSQFLTPTPYGRQFFITIHRQLWLFNHSPSLKNADVLLCRLY